MRLHCEFSTPVARTDLDDYIRHLEISIHCYDEDALNEYLVGKLAVDQILWAEALTDGVSLFDICDNDSQGLHEVHTILTKGKQEFRPDLRITEITSHVMFVYGAVFHPSIHPYRQGILDAALNLFGEESLAVMWKDTSGLAEKELAELGFCKIAGSVADFFVPPPAVKQMNGIEDHDVRITQMLKQFLADAVQDKVDDSLSADAQKAFVPAFKSFGLPFFKSVDSLQSFTLLEHKEVETGISRRYQAIHGKKSVLWSFRLTKEGKIISLEPISE